MNLKLFAVVGQKGKDHQITHSWVMGDQRDLMPWPSILILEAHDGHAMLYRYAADGNFAGDTWHENVEDAKEQAEYEYARVLNKWKEIPSDVQDAIEFALKKTVTGDPSYENTDS